MKFKRNSEDSLRIKEQLMGLLEGFRAISKGFNSTSFGEFQGIPEVSFQPDRSALGPSRYSCTIWISCEHQPRRVVVRYIHNIHCPSYPSSFCDLPDARLIAECSELTVYSSPPHTDLLYGSRSRAR